MICFGPPLHCAATKDFASLVRVMLWLGADPETGANAFKDSVATTPIVWAARVGSVDAVRILYEEGANLAGGRNVFSAAGKNGHFGVVRMLMEAGVDANDCLDDGRSALNSVLTSNKQGRCDTDTIHEMITLLLEHGADPNRVCSGSSPVFEAAKRGCPESLEIFLKFGGDAGQMHNGQSLSDLINQQSYPSYARQDSPESVAIRRRLLEVLKRHENTEASE